MMLAEGNEIVREEETIANIMNNCFTNITTQLKLKPTKTDPKANLESIIVPSKIMRVFRVLS